MLEESIRSSPLSSPYNQPPHRLGGHSDKGSTSRHCVWEPIVRFAHRRGWAVFLHPSRLLPAATICHERCDYLHRSSRSRLLLPWRCGYDTHYLFCKSSSNPLFGAPFAGWKWNNRHLMRFHSPSAEVPANKHFVSLILHKDDYLGWLRHHPSPWQLVLMAANLPSGRLEISRFEHTRCFRGKTAARGAKPID